jgi:anti-sigma regulatory factor (Ser/Thr protein kinase)
MEDLSLHILDIAENSITAGATTVGVKIVEDTRENILVVEIRDNGKGMDKEELRKVHDPFFTTKTTRRVGLGIPLIAQAARESSGGIDIETAKGQGTTITARFQYNHIDRRPLGDIGETISILIAANPGIDFLYEHRRNDNSYSLSTAEIKQKLEAIPINDPKVIKFIKDDISEWLNKTKSIIVDG